MSKKKQKHSKIKSMVLAALLKVKALALSLKSMVMKNLLGLLNLAMSVAVLVKLCQLDQHLLNVYLNLAEGLGINLIFLMQVAAKLFGGDPA